MEAEIIALDLTGAQSVREVHGRLKEAFGFPTYYGRNWDALSDCLAERFGRESRCQVEICGFFSMEEAVRRACRPMLQIFNDIHEQSPDVQFILTP